jgi:hypothetical protein
LIVGAQFSPAHSFSHQCDDCSQTALGAKRHTRDSNTGKIRQKCHTEPVNTQQAGRCGAAGAHGWTDGCGQHRPTNSRWSRRSRVWTPSVHPKSPRAGQSPQRPTGVPTPMNTRDFVVAASAAMFVAARFLFRHMLHLPVHLSSLTLCGNRFSVYLPHG